MRSGRSGAGHSFTPIAATDGISLRLDRMSGVRRVEVDTGRVTLGAGTRLRDLPALLEPYGLALQNMGDIDAQTIAGAISTGTHGTGADFTGLAGQVRRAADGCWPTVPWSIVRRTSVRSCSRRPGSAWARSAC